jgi:hypothetical protein
MVFRDGYSDGTQAIALRRRHLESIADTWRDPLRLV